jgi:tetratricopeptide (TPR) repeat protein
MPDDVDTIFDHGNDLLASGRAAEAMACYEQVLRVRPDAPELLGNLGVCCAELGRLDEALRWYDAALARQPQYPEALYNRGNALRELKRYSEALAVYETALRLNANFPEAWMNRGLALMRLGRAVDAVASYRETLRLRPGEPENINNLGLALQALGYVEDAIDHFSETIRKKPEHSAARCNRAQAWLLKGDFNRGWPEYEWRFRLPGRVLPQRDLPNWDGSPPEGRTILVRHEQGMGDTIQFVRYAALIAQRGGRVVLECPARLHRLLAKVDGVERLIDRDDNAAGCNLQSPLLSLPRLFKTDFRNIPAEVPYLKVEPKLVKRWRAELPAGKCVGICWKGNSDYPEDGFRSIPLSLFGALAEVPGIRLVSLQLGEGVEQIPAFRERYPLHELPPELDAGAAFVDTAAVMMSLGLVVTCDTSIAHLAGALGRPVWLALPLSSEWRWFRDRVTSPWYPTMRLFRQQEPGDWAEVFARMHEELTPLAGS